jgi:entry exclusion lipoprotein TrbK
MTVERRRLRGFIAIILISSTACSPKAPKPHLQVNDETCKPEKLSAINDKAAKQQLASACARRGEFKPSEKKSW